MATMTGNHERAAMNAAPRAHDKLALGWRARVPMVLQTEAAECGLACLAMLAGYHGAPC
jgi:ATP-binding cassette, subfamily B, bacterial CvaB/MchF/RaxB